MTLTEFLMDRIAEDEAVAQAVGSQAWRWVKTREPGLDEDRWSLMREDGSVAVHTQDGENYASWLTTKERHDDTENVERFYAWTEAINPARVLAECASKRAILELRDDKLLKHTERGDASAYGAGLMLDDVLRFLALPYADHPDYDEGWRP